ncbi:MAG TPA: S53 family peptidase [Pseudonocardiaceae bacterium]|nr:S53 family peptidase [Pseudonocardiaceae bacterium]
MAAPTASAATAHASHHSSSSATSGLVANFACNSASAADQVHCLGKLKVKRASNGRLAPLVTSGPTGFGAPDIQSAYNLSGSSGSGRTVAIVDAFDDPNAEADLAHYRSQYGLPACTTANGCFKKVGQAGTSTLPTADAGWALEESLDLDMVSAACPSCNIELFEASSANDPDLLAAVKTASTTPGVAAISNSYGESESSSTEGTWDAVLKGITDKAVTVSSGDSGYGVEWPAASQYVTAVGGTSLSKASNTRGWSETAWSSAGSGCSAYEAKPSWQTDAGCAKRSVADVSAVADPNTGVAVYDTYNTCGTSSLCDVLISLGLVQGADGWVEVGGTSASSPIIASVYALAGNTASTNYGSTPYAHTGSLNDVTSGSNSTSGCTPSYECTAGPGYDGPTGLGTPNGTGAF